MKEIALSGKNGAGLFTIVDDHWYEDLAAFTWHLTSNGYVQRSVTIESFDEMRAAGRKTRKTFKVRLHRYVMGVAVPGLTDLEVDHIDANPLNNQEANLRILKRAHHRQHTSSFTKVTSSPYRGVIWDKSRGLWKAMGCVDSQRVNIGRFSTEKEAAIAAFKWRQEYLPFSIEDPPVF